MLLYLCIPTLVVFFISPISAYTSVSSPIYATDYSATDLRWIYLEYDFEGHDRKEWLMKEGIYDKKSPFILDLDVWKSGTDWKHVLVAVNMPKKMGVPATWGTVSKMVVDGGPVIEVFPDWEWHNLTHGECNRKIVNTYSTASDNAHRHWVLDTGIAEGKKFCPPKIMAFESSGKLYEHHEIELNEISKNSLSENSLVSSMVVENEAGKSGKFHVYMGGITANELIIYNGDKVWTVKSNYFESAALETKLSKIEKNFGFKWGIGAFALTPEKIGGERKLFLRSIASQDVLTIPTAQLHASHDPSKPVEFKQYKNIFSSPVMSMAFSESGILFAALPDEGVISCWDMDRPFTATNIETLERRQGDYLTAIKIVPHEITGDGEQLYVAWNRNTGSTGNNNHTNQNVEIINFAIDERIKKICAGPQPTKLPKMRRAPAALTSAKKTQPSSSYQEGNSCGNFFTWTLELLCKSIRTLGCIFGF